MVYRLKKQEINLIRSERRLFRGHEVHAEAPNLRLLREEVYNGLKDMLHHNPIEDRMAVVRILAPRATGIVEDSWIFYALMSSFHIRYRQNDRCRLGLLEKKLLLMQSRVDKRCSAEDLEPFSFDTSDHPAREGYRGLADYIRAFQCLADRCIRKYDGLAKFLLEKRQSLVDMGKLPPNAPTYQHFPEGVEADTIDPTYQMYSAHEEVQVRDAYREASMEDVQDVSAANSPPHQPQRHASLSSDADSDVPVYTPNSNSLPVLDWPGLPGSTVNPESSDGSADGNISPRGSEQASEGRRPPPTDDKELSTGLEELSIGHREPPRGPRAWVAARGRGGSTRGLGPPRGGGPSRASGRARGRGRRR